jgi:oligosaccharide repeat unit polymerase
MSLNPKAMIMLIVNQKKLVLGRKNIIVINAFILLFLIITPFWGPSIELLGEEVIYSLCVLIMGLSIWIAFTIKYISPDVFNFYSLFILSAILFNGGQAFLEVFHLNDMGILNGRFRLDTLALTLYMVLLSLASFHMGGLIGVRRMRWPDKNSAQPNYSPKISAKALRIVGYVLLAISTVPTLILIINVLKVVWDSGYFTLYQQDRSAGLAGGLESVVYSLSRFFIPGLLFLFAGSKTRYIIRTSIIVTFFVYVFTFILLGHRGHGTMTLLAGLWAWHIIVRPIPIYKLISYASFLLFVIFPTIRLLRNIAGTSRASFQFIVDSYLSIESPAIMIISEMGASMGTIAYTLDLIPEFRPFALGSTYAYVASSLIPNFFWNLHPAVEFGSLSRWLTMTVAPYNFRKGGGLGYSFIAEAYANFGLIGIPVFMCLLGFAIAKLTNWPFSRQDYPRIALVAVCISSTLFWTRGDFNFIFRPLIFYALMPYVAVIFIRREINRRTHAKSLKIGLK